MPSQGVGLPTQSINQQDSVGTVSRESIARQVAEGHRKGLQAKKYRDLTAQKYILHIDGEGDAQLADLFDGQRTVVPTSLSGRVMNPNNILRPMVDNMVAYHTTQPFAFLAESRNDAESKRKALFDAAIVNHVSRNQRWNSLSAEAMYMGAGYGMGLIHAFWRDDLAFDPYEPLYDANSTGFKPRRGLIDCWVGNPFDTVYNPGAKRNSVRWMSYGRVLPADDVRKAFAHVKGIEGLTGTKRLPSASVFQRIARQWNVTGINVHGTATMQGGEGHEEELIAIVCREVAPGVSEEWPEGKLVIVGLRLANDGSLDTSRSAVPLLLHEGPLPAGRFSSVRLYSGFRNDDILGRAYVTNLDDKQMQLNELESLFDEYIRKAVRSPLAHDGLLSDTTSAWEDDGVLEYEPGVGRKGPSWLTPPSEHLRYIESKIQRVEQMMFRAGGWQAASRGETQPGQPAALAVYLGRADDTVHGPINVAFRESMSELAELVWANFKAFGDVGWAINIGGDDLAHLAEEYIDNTKISDEAPRFRMTNGAGSTTEATEQMLLNMVVASGADGQPLLPTAQLRKLWPNQDLYSSANDPQAIRVRHAKTVASAVRDMSRTYREQTGFEDTDPASPWLLQAAKMVHNEILRLYKPRRDDDLQAMLDALSEITQDDTEDVLARSVGEMHQDIYYEWQRSIHAQSQPALGPTQKSGPTGAPQAVDRDAANSPSSKGAEMAMNEVGQLTQQAMGA